MWLSLADKPMEPLQEAPPVDLQAVELHLVAAPEPALAPLEVEPLQEELQVEALEAEPQAPEAQEAEVEVLEAELQAVEHQDLELQEAGPQVVELQEAEPLDLEVRMTPLLLETSQQTGKLMPGAISKLVHSSGVR